MVSKSKARFEKTEIGMIPEDWEEKQLGKLVTFQRGHDLPRKDMKTGKYPVVGSNGIIGYNDIFKAKGPGVTIGRSGNLGKPLFVKEDYWPHNTVLFVKDFHNSSPKFVYYFLKILDLSKYNAGSAVPTLNRNHIHTLPVIVPKRINEQLSIAKILSDLDSKIELNIKINRVLETIGQALFKRWFIDFEFPDEKGRPYKSSGGKMVDSELGEIPIGWRIGQVEEIANVIGGGTPSTKRTEYFTEKGIAWITPKDLSNYHWKYLSRGHIDITQEGLKNSGAKIMPRGTILFTSRAPIGYVAIAADSVSTNQGFKSLIPKEKYYSEYLYCLIKNSVPKLESMASGSTFKEVPGILLKKFNIVVPLESLVEHFSKVLFPISERMHTIQEETDRLIVVRDLLLPKLMSGKIRVPIEARG